MWRWLKRRVMMNVLTQMLDGLWNLRFLTGYRTKVARWLLIGLSTYQGLATSAQVSAAGLHLPPLSATVFIPLMAYLGAKITQFAAEHKPPT